MRQSISNLPVSAKKNLSFSGQPVKLLFAQNMSSATTVRQELNRLFLNAVIPEKEFGDLLTYTSNNPDKIPDLEDSLKYGNDNVKAIYLKNILTGMFSYN